MIELVDIDLDAAVVNSAGNHPREPQSLCTPTLEGIRRVIDRTPRRRWFMDEHVWAFRLWQEAAVRGASVWHLDAHHDAYGSTDPSVWRTSLTPGFGCSHGITSATYLLAAWRAGIVAEIVWLVPEWLGLAAARLDLEREMGPSCTAFTLATFGSIEPPATPDMLTVAWSRRWVEPRLHQPLVAGALQEEVANQLNGGASFVGF